jgi:hypothetical protein
MKFVTKLFFINLFIATTVFGADFQYFLSPYFFKNPQSYWVNGNQNIKYNLGELFSEGIDQAGINLYKCRNENISDAVINIYPVTVYNPVTYQLQSDVKIRIYSLKKKNIDELLVIEKQVIHLDTNSEKKIIAHYKNVSNKIYQSLQALDLGTDKKMNGEICNAL